METTATRAGGAAGYAPAPRLAALPRARVLDCTVPVAVSRRSRLLGLAFLARHQAGPGLLIPNCSSVHTFGMRFGLELVFLDEAGRVLRRVLNARRRRSYSCRGAAAVVEFPRLESEVRPPGGHLS